MLDLEFRTMLTEHPFPKVSNNLLYHNENKNTRRVISSKIKLDINELPYFILKYPNRYINMEMNSNILHFSRRSVNMNRIKEILYYADGLINIPIKNIIYIAAKGFLAVIEPYNINGTGVNKISKILLCVSANKNKVVKTPKDLRMYVDREIYSPAMKRFASIIKPMISQHTGDVIITNSIDNFFIYRFSLPTLKSLEERMKFEDNMETLFFRGIKWNKFEKKRIKEEEEKEKERIRIEMEETLGRTHTIMQVFDDAIREEAQAMERASLEGDRLQQQQNLRAFIPSINPDNIPNPNILIDPGTPGYPAMNADAHEAALLWGNPRNITNAPPTVERTNNDPSIIQGAESISEEEIMRVMNSFNIASVNPPAPLRYAQAYDEATQLVNPNANISSSIPNPPLLTELTFNDIMLDVYRHEVEDSGEIISLYNISVGYILNIPPSYVQNVESLRSFNERAQIIALDIQDWYDGLSLEERGEEDFGWDEDDDDIDEEGLDRLHTGDGNGEEEEAFSTAEVVDENGIPIQQTPWIVSDPISNEDSETDQIRIIDNTVGLVDIENGSIIDASISGRYATVDLSVPDNS